MSNTKIKDCGEVGFKSTLITYEDDITENRFAQEGAEINNDPEIDGLIVQLPLPETISENRIIETINFKKDVDGFHPVNLGRMLIGLPCLFLQHQQVYLN